MRPSCGRRRELQLLLLTLHPCKPHKRRCNTYQRPINYSINFNRQRTRSPCTVNTPLPRKKKSDLAPNFGSRYYSIQVVYAQKFGRRYFCVCSQNTPHHLSFSKHARQHALAPTIPPPRPLPVEVYAPVRRQEVSKRAQVKGRVPGRRGPRLLQKRR